MNSEKRISEEYFDREKEIQFKKFIAEQAMWPPDKWSAEFNDYVGQKLKEDEEDFSLEAAPEKMKDNDFKKYLKGFDFREEELQNKKILDLGCGEGNFIKEIIDRNYTKEAYGADRRIGTDVKFEGAEKKYSDHFFNRDFSEELPIKNCDYVLSYAAMDVVDSVSDASDGSLNVSMIRERISSAINALSDNGELRVFPLWKAPEFSDAEGFKLSYAEWNSVLNEMAEDGRIKYELKPIDIQVRRLTDGGKEVFLKELLIIKKAKNENA